MDRKHDEGEKSNLFAEWTDQCLVLTNSCISLVGVILTLVG